MNIKINTNFADSFVSKNELEKLKPYLEFYHKSLVEKTGKGNDFLGWLDLPTEILNDNSLFEKVQSIKEKWEKLKITHIVVIGIGGSYLGTKAVSEALISEFDQSNNPKLIFAGHHMSSSYLNSLFQILDKLSFGVIVISKSGTTLEPALAFRLIKQKLVDRFGEENCNDRIVAITDKSKGALRKLANLNSWSSFDIADDIGGRYSVLSPVGIVPLMLAGLNVKELINGAIEAEKFLKSKFSFEDNPALKYAAIRYLLYNSGKPVELLVSFNPELQYFAEWWKQLFGESDGKDNKGIFPGSAIFSTDLHSMGQYIQEGLRVLFETFISVEGSDSSLVVPKTSADEDGLNYLAGREVAEINSKAAKATMLAHYEGNVPVIEISIPEMNEFNLGSLMYFFEFACAISGYLLDVNPFNQPGVEAYKLNMFALLGKPGMENETQEILRKLL